MSTTTKRKAIGKSQRFRIFNRDDHTCRYCGAQPPDVKLVIDHIVAVANGGTNDDANLIASCESCNSGKSAKSLGSIAATDTDTRRLAQEYMEQVDMAKIAADAAKARRELKQTLEAYWCEVFKVGFADKSTVTRLTTLSDEYGPSTVIQWIDIAAAKLPFDREAMRYINGIARNVRESDIELLERAHSLLFGAMLHFTGEPIPDGLHEQFADRCSELTDELDDRLERAGRA